MIGIAIRKRQEIVILAPPVGNPTGTAAAMCQPDRDGPTHHVKVNYQHGRIR